MIPTEIDQAIALGWLRYSLGQGEIVSPAALKFIEDHEGHAYTLAPERVDPARLTEPREGGVIKPGAGSPQEALARELERLTGRGGSCVVVEDELGRRRDPKPSLDGLLLTAFVGEQVLHWADLADGTEAAILTVDRGSHGYPLNAFVASASAQELGLVDGADLDSDIAGAVVRSLMAVIVAAYDDETFVIWEPTSAKYRGTGPHGHMSPDL
ncbi:MAG TPA: hypothetical protein VG147_01215 [Solirubrobacteraceae bacterium]|nr:hypothetical protein [Solirubrobacteraceae bacterium]